MVPNFSSPTRGRSISARMSLLGVSQVAFQLLRISTYVSSCEAVWKASLYGFDHIFRSVLRCGLGANVSIWSWELGQSDSLVAEDGI